MAPSSSKTGTVSSGSARCERVDYNGELFRLRNFQLRERPLRPAIPIMIASIGPRNIELAGELADGWLPIFLRRDAIPAMREQLAAGARRSGRDPGAIEIAPSVIAAVAESPNEARALARAHIAYYVGGMGAFYNRLMRQFGWEPQAARIRAEWRRPNRAGRAAAAAAVTDEMVDATSAVGSRVQSRERLEEARSAGVTLPILMFPFGASKALMRGTLEALAPD